MSYARKLRRAEVKRRKAVDAELRRTITEVARSFNEVKTYLAEHEDDKVAMSYDLVNELFGNLNEKHLSRIFRNALRGKI